LYTQRPYRAYQSDGRLMGDEVEMIPVSFKINKFLWFFKQDRYIFHINILGELMYSNEQKCA
jgi:hypothetical protein